HNFAGIGQTTGNGKNFFLRPFHFADLNRPFGFEVVTQQFGRPFGHIAENLVLHLRIGTFQRHDQQVGRHFAQQNLNAAVVNIHQVVKHEHKILNLNAQVFVHFFNLVKQVGGNVAVNKVNDVSRRFNATNTGGL